MLSGMNPLLRTVVLCCLVLPAATCCAHGPPVTERADPTPAARQVARQVATDHAPATGHWRRVLRRLDRRRERAFTDGEVARLRQVYAAGSPLLRRDARVLREYRRRGLRLESARLRLTSVETVRQTSRRVVLRVVDTLARVRVRTPGGRWRVLPRDRPSERTIVLRRSGTGWRIVGIRPVGAPSPTRCRGSSRRPGPGTRSPHPVGVPDVPAATRGPRRPVPRAGSASASPVPAAPPVDAACGPARA